MTSNRRAGLGRSVLGLGFAGSAGADRLREGTRPGKDRRGAQGRRRGAAEEGRRAARASRSSATARSTSRREDDAYLVSIEGLKVQPSPEGYLEVGTVSYLAKPKDETSYEVSNLTRAPDHAVQGRRTGTDKGKLIVTTKSFSGLYSKALTTFQQMDAEFADIIATDDQGGEVGLGNAKFTVNVADKGGGVVDAIGQGHPGRAHRQGDCGRRLHRRRNADRRQI